MKYAHLYALFLMFVFCTPSKGQNKTNLPTDSIKSETKDVITANAPNTMVRNIKKDRNGHLLIAASISGVFRYDGKSFTNLTNEIGSRSFWDVLEDRRGNLWFATTYSGVYYYDGKSFRNFTTQDGLASDQVTCIYEDKSGNIWFGTGGGASRYDGKSFRNFTTKEGLSNNDVTSIIEDRTGKLWFGTRGNACFYDGKTFTVFPNLYNVWSIIEDKKGNIWLGGSRFGRYDGSTFTIVNERSVYFIYEDKKGNIWTSSITEGGWLSRYDEKSLSIKKPISNEITTHPTAIFGILEANDGSIWFGATDGVYRYDGSAITRL